MFYENIAFIILLVLNYYNNIYLYYIKLYYKIFNIYNYRKPVKKK